MTVDQGLAFAVLGGMMALFIWGRFRYDVVASVALVVAVLAGLVPAEKAFEGFSDDIVIIVACALIASAAVARSGVMEIALQRVSPYLSTVRLQVIVLVTVVTVLSAFVKNIGALALMIPIALQLARRSEASPSIYLMPMSFGALLGGLMTLVGTSPNIIVSRVRQEMTGEPFSMFDFTPVGAGLALTGIVFLALFYWLLPGNRSTAATIGEAIDIKDYMTEARASEGATVIGRTVRELEEEADGEVTVTGIVRRGQWPTATHAGTRINEGDIVLLEGEPQALARLVDSARLELEGADRIEAAEKASDKKRDGKDEKAPEGEVEIGSMEAVIGPTSLLIGHSARGVRLHGRFNVTLLAVSRSGQRFTERLRNITLRNGDVVLLKGRLHELPEKLRDLGCLPLAGRELRLGNARKGLIPLATLGAAMLLTAVGALPVAMAFFIAAAIIVLTGALSLRETYDSVEWPILVMLGALIPVSDSLRTTGATDLIAGWLSNVAALLPSYGALALILVAAMAVTPFLNNAATVLVMAPIAASFAARLGHDADAFLMAVAIGAGCDFLTPIGHQCNTLVMGPGGYRFGDYWRLGLPLSFLVIVVGTPLILLVWPT